MGKPLLVGDMFCGAGGSSTGAKRALTDLGIEHEIVAVNHWDIAIATHSANHPTARHICSNVYRLAPLEAVPEGRLDLLMASPTCTFNSRARGGKPISRDQKYGRMTPTQVLRWCRELDVKCLIVENVPEFQFWTAVHLGPEIDKDGLEIAPAPPLPERCAKVGQCRPGRPCHRRKGAYFRTWLRRLEGLGFRYEWRILNAADYGDPTTRQRFFLMARSDGGPIRWPEPSHSKAGSGDLFGAGAQRWVGAREIIDWTLRGKSIFNRAKPLSPKTMARIYAGAVRFGWPEPFLVILRRHMDAQSIDEPTPTVTAGGTHIGLAQAVPFVTRYNGGPKPRASRSVEDPLSTQDTANRMGLVEPMVFQVNQGAGRARNMRPTSEPLPTVVTGESFGLVVPLTHTQGRNKASSVAAPVPTLTTAKGGEYAVVEPVLLPQGGGGNARPVSEPTPTIATDGAIAMISPYYGTGRASTVGDPLPTQTTKDRFGLVLPVTHAGARRARPVEEPLPTVTGAHRGELAMIVGAFGEREGQAPRVHSIDEPAPTICARGSVRLVHGAPDCDILFRMLQPRELARAMSLEGEDGDYIFKGNKGEIIRQIGNAVPARTAEALVRALMGPN